MVDVFFVCVEEGAAAMFLVSGPLQVSSAVWKVKSIGEVNMDDGDKPRLESEVAAYRQPMVTSLGIILGFMLAFLANWASQASDEPAVASASDWLIFGALAVSIALSVIVLYRLLDNHVHLQPGQRYQTTLKLYMTAIIVAFAGLAAALVI